MKKRVLWIDIAKCVGILLMIYNHISLEAGQESIKLIIASFHMPLFFFLSGLTFKDEGKQKLIALGKYILIRFIILMVPYYLWSFIYADRFSIKTIAMVMWGNNESLRLVSDNAALWFLPCMFAACVITKIELYLRNLLRKLRYNIICCIILAITNFVVGWVLTPIKLFRTLGWPLGINIAFVGSGFIFCGMIIKIICERVKTNRFNCEDAKTARRGGGTWLRVRLLMILAAIGFNLISTFLNVDAIDNTYGRCIMARSLWGNEFWFVISGITGSFTVIILSQLIDNVPKLKSFMAEIGRNTIIILAIHVTVIKILEKTMVYIHLPDGILITFLIAILTLLITYFFAKIIKAIAPNLSVGDVSALNSSSPK